MIDDKCVGDYCINCVCWFRCLGLFYVVMDDFVVVEFYFFFIDGEIVFDFYE